jgi:hypothetical protein
MLAGAPASRLPKLKEQLSIQSVAFCDPLSGEVFTAGDEKTLARLDALRAAANGEVAW